MGRPFIWEMREGQEEGKKKKKVGTRRRRVAVAVAVVGRAGCKLQTRVARPSRRTRAQAAAV